VASHEFTLGTRAVARVAAALWLGCGALAAVAIPLLASAPDADRAGIVLIGIFAVVVGAVVWFLPWDRWSHRSTLALVPVAFLVIALFNRAANDPWSYDVFFLVSFAWVGLAHAQGTALAASPLLVAAYLIPLIGVDDAGHGAASLVYVLPTSVLLGEAVSWVAGRLRDAERARALSEARYSALVRAAAEYVVVVDDGGTVMFAGAALERVLGVTPDEFVGRSGADVVHPDDLAVVNLAFAEVRGGNVPRRTVTYRALNVDGGWRWIEGTVSDLRDDPSVGGIVVNGRDVTERMEAEERLAHLARHDPLTGLPNRAALLDDLERAMARAERRGASVGVLFLDLDGFKIVNDSLGHAVGDEVLVAAAARVGGLLRSGDLLARLGGDEFTVVVETMDDPSEPIALAERLITAMRHPLEIDGRRHVVTASIGIAVSVPGERDAAEVLRQADLAMYRAKELGKGRYEVFDQSLARRARRRLDIEAELRTALEANELELHYQPEMDIAADRVVGMEALVRWRHPVRGLLPPSEFIDIAEESDLILDLGRFVLDRAVRTAAEWVVRFGDRAPEMSVNVSAKQLHDPSFLDDVRNVLRTHQVIPQMLRLEITESVLADAVAPGVLAELQAMGISVAIDDFGTGYSSLSYLDRLPVDVVKIDRAFLAPVLTGDDRAPVVEATLAMARSLGLAVVAEGVETPAHVTLLLRLGCLRAQGFFFGRPAPSAVVERLLAEEDLGGIDEPRLVAPWSDELEAGGQPGGIDADRR
jgi:diguanylate cyclase (GGDEF)-like protein/PAS domain S-box-containing protein